jgi:hypothetical protein
MYVYTYMHYTYVKHTMLIALEWVFPIFQIDVLDKMLYEKL